jgi:hypothetical protein
LVGGGMGKKQPSLVADAEPPDDPGAGDGGPDHGDGAGELPLEHTACRGQSTRVQYRQGAIAIVTRTQRFRFTGPGPDR